MTFEEEKNDPRGWPENEEPLKNNPPTKWKHETKDSGEDTQRTEKDFAIWMANNALDIPFVDPDSNLNVISRQFLRSQEELASLREQLDTSWKEVNRVGSENDNLNSELAMTKDQLKKSYDEINALECTRKMSVEVMKDLQDQLKQKEEQLEYYKHGAEQHVKNLQKIAELEEQLKQKEETTKELLDWYMKEVVKLQGQLKQKEDENRDSLLDFIEWSYHADPEYAGRILKKYEQHLINKKNLSA